MNTLRNFELDKVKLNGDLTTKSQLFIAIMTSKFTLYWFKGKDNEDAYTSG